MESKAYQHALHLLLMLALHLFALALHLLLVLALHLFILALQLFMLALLLVIPTLLLLTILLLLVALLAVNLQQESKLCTGGRFTRCYLSFLSLETRLEFCNLSESK